jgi:hypothetical protein
MINPEVKTGDRIICYHMESELSVPPGTKGTVVRVSRDPFESNDEKIVEVKWDNGSKLSLLSSQDIWKLDKKNIKEAVQAPPEYDYFKQNPEIFVNYDWRFLKKYLYLLRDTGLVNMFEASPFLFSGKEWIDRYYGEGREDDEKFQKFLDESENAKNKMIQGTLKYMESKGKEIEIEEVNRILRRMAQKMVQLYVTFN